MLFDVRFSAQSSAENGSIGCAINLAKVVFLLAAFFPDNFACQQPVWLRCRFAGFEDNLDWASTFGTDGALPSRHSRGILSMFAVFFQFTRLAVPS
jgi:hypothetical protein